LPSKAVPVTQRRSNQSHLERFTRACENRAQSFVLPTVNLVQLKARLINTIEEIETANNRMEEMRSWTADACSGRWYDKTG
jgi:hypothetical protein